MNIQQDTQITCRSFTTLESALKSVSVKCPCNNCSLCWRDDKNCWECNYNKNELTDSNYCSIDTILIQ